MPEQPPPGNDPPGSPRPRSPSTAPSRSPLVLILDADPSTRAAYGSILRHAGFRSLLTSSIEETTDSIRETSPDVIVADVRQQGPFGLDALSLAERYCPTCPVIYTSSPPLLDDAAKTLRQGAFDFLIKPVDKEKLLRKVDAAFRHKLLLDRQHRLERENADYREHLEELVAERTQAVEKANRRLCVEIAERERAEQALLNQSIFLETLMASIPTPMFYKDTEGMYLGCNEAFTEFVGQSRKNILGKTAFECWPGHNARIYHNRDVELLRTGGVQEYEGPVCLSNGEERHVMFKKAVFPKADGSTGGIIGIIVDATHRKRLEKALRRATRQAEAANRAKSEFLASMSHEIRTPMTAILGMADLLWNSRLSSEQKSYVSTLRGAGENLLELINDILDLSRIESGHLQIEDIAFSPWELADRACDVVAKAALDKGLELVCHVDPNLPPHVQGDPARLNQICVNLLGNAVKFTEKGEVVLRVDALDAPPVSMFHIQVSDTGIGIAPEDQEAIFERFTQADASTTRLYGGTGLGLSICKSLLEQMQGEIWVESSLGQGSVFHVALPLREASCALHATPNPVPKPVRLFVAAANPSLRGSLLALARSLDCDALELESPEALLQALEDHAHDLERTVALLDENLAGAQRRPLPPSLGARLASLAVSDFTTLLLCSGGQPPPHWGSGAERFWKGILRKPVKGAELRGALEAAGDVQCGLPRAEAPLDLHQDLAPLRILLVEDSAPTQMMLHEYLKNTPHSLQVAMDGKEGLECFKQQDFDLVLMDLEMPVMDGFQALHEIRRWENVHQRPTTPIFACSAKALKEDEDASMEAGFDLHLSKPLRQGELLAALRKVAETREPSEGDAPKTEPVFLVADDSKVMRTLICKLLKELGHERLIEAGDGQEALARLEQHPVDCVICDWNISRLQGKALLPKIRELKECAATPCIMLTNELPDELDLPASAGDTRFVVKPFRLEEFKALVADALQGREASSPGKRTI